MVGSKHTQEDGGHSIDSDPTMTLQGTNTYLTHGRVKSSQSIKRKRYIIVQMLVVRRVSGCKLGGLVLQRHNAHIIGTVCKRKPQDLVYSLIVYPYVIPHELQRKPSFSGSMSITIPARLLMEELLFPPPGGILEGPRDFPRSHLMTNDSRTHPATQPLRKIYESGGSSGGKTSAPKTIT